MKDITPDLLERIKKDFERQISSNSKISDLIGKLDKGTATYLDANEYSIEIGRTLANVLGKNISSDVLPNGKMYYNIANRIINDTLSRNHDIIADYAAKTQKALNTKAKIGLKVVKPVLNQDRIDGIVNRASSEDRFDNVKWILDEPIVNFSQSIVDDSIRENADIHYQKGLTPRIIRKESGKCCKWCRSIAGIYAYPDVPKDVYRRHQNCRCTQKALNTKAKIGLKVVKPVLNQDRIDGIVNRASSEDRFDNVKWILDEPIVNFSQSIVDDSIRENADIHYQKGLTPRIIRKESGKCCKWCRSIAGIYAYPDVPKDVYRRHQNCRCTVDYYPGDGKVQNVHTKRITKIPTSQFEELKRREKDIKLLNIREDSREYKELVNILGDKAPKSLAMFQDMKYNDIEKYEQIKDHAYIQEMFDSGKWKDKINPEKQARHMESTAPEGKSYFFDDVDIKALYEKHKMSGRIRYSGNKRTGNELIDISADLKLGRDAYSGKYINGFTIKYSKTGSHLIPTFHEEDKK